MDCFTLLEVVFFNKLFILYRSVAFDWFSHFITICSYILSFFIYHLLIIWSYSKIIRLVFMKCCIRPVKKDLAIETSLDLIYILPYYFYLVHVIYCFHLTKIDLFIFIPYPNQVYDKQRKKNLSGDLCVLYMSCPEILLSQDGVFQHSMGYTMVATFGKH